jgi:MFS family permease
MENREKLLVLMLITTFVASTMFSMALPTMAFYLAEISKHNSEGYDASTFYGSLLAIFAVGQLISSPIIGYWYNVRGVQEPMVFSLVLMIISNLLYAFAWNKYILLVSRLLTGLSCSSLTLSRSFLGKVCLPTETNKWMCHLGMCYGLGLIMGPIFGVSLSFINFKFWIVTVNSHTSPGFMASLMGIINLGLFFIAKKHFKDIHSVDRVVSIDEESAPLLPCSKEYDSLLVKFLNIIFFCISVTFSFTETMVNFLH